ncbi:MAG: glycosyl hydrolase family 28-related protein, partial [Limisphaerales bacterium]
MKWIYSAAISLALLAQAGCAGLSRESLNVRAYGATGDGVTKDTAAFQKALDACAAAGGGEVIVSAGNYLIGSIELKSHTTVRLDQGAHLLGSSDLDDYPVMKVRWEGNWIDGHRAL